MITLDYVIYDCIANACMLVFAFLVFKKNSYAWVFVLASLILKVFIYGKYGISTSLIYLSAQILAAILAAMVWLRNPTYIKATKQKKLLVSVVALIILAVWVGLMYKYVNPYIIDYTMLFGFEYLCYMLIVVGCVFLAFRLALGLLFLAIELISYAVNYANSAMVIQNAPQYFRDFVPYYWLSAVLLFIAGIVIVASYTNAKRSV
ncbi:hypothetical protein CGC44_01330 [Francisella opportunistica]|uniref:hypothetical protein n=1 Tax=Francisella TaxID=262 RepID=UPI0008FC8A03|nr:MULTISPECIES: hypothetical protein [Francisella]APC91005.1 putative membrane protein [Francisella sp. MA067296]AXH30978.1 hypothetical protein CGC44_01330 [Francisella opportunistica]